MSNLKNIGALTIALVGCFTFHGFAQVSLTPLEVRTANLMLDNCQRDTALLRACQFELESLKSSLRDANAVIRSHSADIAALERLDSSRVANLNVYRKTSESEKRKGKVKERLLWIVGAVAVVEGVVIAWMVGTK